MTHKLKIIIIALIFLFIFSFVLAQDEMPAGYTSLEVSKNIYQGGEVRLSNPAKLYCGVGCARMSNPYLLGAQITLTAVPAEGYIFTGWSGDCSGTNKECAVIMNSNKTVVANFAAASADQPDSPAPGPRPISPNQPGGSVPSPVSAPIIIVATSSSRSGGFSSGWFSGIIGAFLFIITVLIVLIWMYRRYSI